MPVDSTTGLYYESTGPVDAPAIIFLHGGGVSGWMWRKQVEVLSVKYHCLVPDLPEQGKSIKIGPFSIEFAADCVAELIHSCTRDGKAHVVGLSEGAQIVVSLLDRHPDVIDHAICSSAILLPIPGAWMFSRNMLVFTYRLFMEPWKKCDWWIRLNMHYSAGISDEYFQYFKDSFRQTTECGFIHMMESNMTFRLPQGLENSKVPVLVITGKMEYQQMHQSAKNLLSVLPNAKGVILSLGKGPTLAKEHNWALTVPDLFTVTVKAWIEDSPLPDEFVEL